MKPGGSSGALPPRRGALPTFQASAPAALADEQLRRNLKKAEGSSIRGEVKRQKGPM